jgi:hypothetical protein
VSDKTVSSEFGLPVADRLAALAIDLACDAPESPSTHDTKVRSALIAETRAALEEAGIDWRSLVRRRVADEQQARAAVHAGRRAPA